MQIAVKGQKLDFRNVQADVIKLGWIEENYITPQYCEHY